MIKKITPIALALMAGWAAISSCSKSSTKPSNYLTATVNGTSFKANHVYADRVSPGTAVEVKAYYDSSNVYFYLTTLDTTAPGVYTLVDPATNPFAGIGASYISDTSQINNPNATVYHSFDSGTINVTKVSYNSAKGTFNFYNTKDGTKATGGSFSFTF